MLLVKNNLQKLLKNRSNEQIIWVNFKKTVFTTIERNSKPKITIEIFVSDLKRVVRLKSSSLTLSVLFGAVTEKRTSNIRSFTCQTIINRNVSLPRLGLNHVQMLDNFSLAGIVVCFNWLLKFLRIWVDSTQSKSTAVNDAFFFTDFLFSLRSSLRAWGKVQRTHYCPLHPLPRIFCSHASLFSRALTHLNI